MVVEVDLISYKKNFARVFDQILASSPTRLRGRGDPIIQAKISRFLFRRIKGSNQIFFGEGHKNGSIPGECCIANMPGAGKRFTLPDVLAPLKADTRRFEGKTFRSLCEINLKKGNFGKGGLWRCLLNTC